jgi:REP element-mobilizing transposase RayT
MPQSLSQIISHFVFSTKDRVPNLEPEMRPELFAYLTTLIRNRGHTPIFIGGHDDHVHLLIGLSRTETIAKLVEHTKVESSKWLKTTGPNRRDFSWQRGYGAFGIAYSDVDKAIAYIAHQDAHHQKESYQDEFRRIMKENGIAIDERFVWD